MAKVPIRVLCVRFPSAPMIRARRLRLAGNRFDSGLLLLLTSLCLFPFVIQGSEIGLEEAYKDGYLDRDRPYMSGSEAHYNFFESLISGRELTSLPPKD